MEKIGILGIGKLGLCLALHLEKAGYEVTGVDIIPSYVEAINARTLQSPEPLVEETLLQARCFRATTDPGQVICDAISMILVQVATPSTPEGGYDHSQIDRVASRLIEFGRRKLEVHLVIGCTTMPGYCDRLAERLAPYNYTVSYNPEFIAQGSIMKDMVNPDLVLIGEGNERAGHRIEEVYRNICRNQPVFHRMERLSAEISKLAINCFLTTKISFANSIGDLALRAGADPGPILAAIGSDSRIGSKYLNYGFGFGGPCFPRDNRALGLYARETGVDLPLSRATDEVNRRHLDFQFGQWMQRYPPAQTIEFEYVTYKKEAVSLEESQQLALALRLAKAGRTVAIRGRQEVIEQLQNSYGDLFQYRVNHACKK